MSRGENLQESSHWGQWKTSPSELVKVQNPPALPQLPTPSLQCCSPLGEHVHTRTASSENLHWSFYCRAGEKPHHIKTIRTNIFNFYLASTFYFFFFFFIIICTFTFYYAEKEFIIQ